MAREIAERIIIKVNAEELYKEKYIGNQRENPLHSERRGMEEMLKLMGIDFEYGYEFINNDYKIVSITVDGVTVNR